MFIVASKEFQRLRSTGLVVAVLSLGFALMFGSSVHAEMKALDDELLSGVSGQSGITLDLQANIGIEEAAYFEDGNGIALQGMRLSAASGPADYAEFRLLLDILADGDLVVDFESNNTARFEIEEIRFVDNPGITPLPDAPSIGGVFLDFDIDGSLSVQNRGNNPIGSLGVVGGVYDLEFLITDGRLGYRTNGNEFFFDGMTLDVAAPGLVLGATPGGELVLDLPSFLAELSVDAIRFSNNPLNHGVTEDVVSGVTLPSYGSLWANIDMASTWRARAGGRLGTEGLTINSETTINRLDLAWGDDTDWGASGYWAGLLGMSGQVDVSNLTLDVLPDPDNGVTPGKDYGMGLALAFDQLAFNLQAADLVLGVTKNEIDAYVNSGAVINSVGSIGLNLLFADGSFDGSNYTNSIYVQSGGNSDSGYQGLRLDTELSLFSAANESNFVYSDNGNSLMFSKLEGFVDGDLTLDVTAAGLLGSTEFFDGLRLGFEDFAFGYQVEGFRAGRDTGDSEDLKTKSLQSGQAMQGLSSAMFGLPVAPSLKGVINGHITLGPGGNLGQEGITINSDIILSDATMASYLESDGSGRGLWLSGLNYDVHLRDMMLDVTDEGLRIYESESWSKMDVTDFKVGDQVSGASFGRLVMETYEQGSVTTVSAGGAGAVCIGAIGVDAGSCASEGGRWEDRGDQGLSISSQRFFKDSIEAEGKRNRFTWETARQGEGSASPLNGTGMQLVFDNFTTNDGDGVNDTYGFRTDYSLDVAQSYVVKKEDGTDSNGVSGAKGSIKVMNPDGTYQYVLPADLTAQDLNNLPVGIATRTRTHFKELDFEEVKLVHPVGGESTLLYGLKLQNFDVTTDITATPLD